MLPPEQPERPTALRLPAPLGTLVSPSSHGRERNTGYGPPQGPPEDASEGEPPLVVREMAAGEADLIVNYFHDHSCTWPSPLSMRPGSAGFRPLRQSADG